jgi:hypothetical protein
MTRGTQGETALPAQKFSISGAQGKGQSRTVYRYRRGKSDTPCPQTRRLRLSGFTAIRFVEFSVKSPIRRLVKPRCSPFSVSVTSELMASTGQVCDCSENGSWNCHTARQSRHLIFLGIGNNFTHRIGSRFELESQIHKYPKLKKVRHLVVQDIQLCAALLGFN